nr:GntR family transcriptional regulator [Sphingomonas sp.]
MSQPSTFDRVYMAIKERLRHGDFRPGDRLEPTMLSQDLNASVTPIRDALHRLTGERLVEAPRHEGFRAPLLTESMLRHLYAWHLDILLLAIARRKAECTLHLDHVEDAPLFERLNGIFVSLAAASDNPEHGAALKTLTERLEPYNRFEREFLDAVEAETEQIASAIEANDVKSLRRALVQYHRRRDRVVPQLLARLHNAR